MTNSWKVRCLACISQHRDCASLLLPVVVRNPDRVTPETITDRHKANRLASLDGSDMCEDTIRSENSFVN